jgi:multiple sugar transport system permease protein
MDHQSVAHSARMDVNQIAAPIPGGGLQTTKKVAIQSIVLLILLIVACYFMLPIFWILIASTKSANDLSSTGIFSLPGKIHFFENLRLLATYQHGVYWLWFLNSAIYSVTVAVLTCIVSAMAGFALAKYDFRGRNGVFLLVIASLMIPGTVTAIPLFIVEKALGLVNTYAGVILPLIASPFGVYFLRIYIQDVVPNDLMDAARVDGASSARLFWSIVFPVIRPALVTLFLICLVGTWNNFFLPLVLLNNQSMYPLPVGIESLMSLINTPEAAMTVPLYPLIITGSLISIAPMIIGFILFRKQIVTGLIQGSVKL